MAYEPLHHKYRPQTFAELVGQSAITTTLTNALRQQKIAPAYLFTGARGTGKTSSARILAKSLNCLTFDQPTEKPCGVCDVCRAIANGSALDVIEIDAASNTGVDNIRELIERAQFAPVQCRYKVYVIDECHMLSAAAFNALLKTLEEPPNQVVFVLATTDPQRVLPTIISRCQRFDFRRIELEAMVQHLSKIAAQESINITADAIQLVAQIAQGGLRDAESTLDQLSLLEGQITVERVWDLVGAVPERDLLAIVEAIAANDSTLVIDRVRQLMDRGREPLIVLQNLASFYRDLLIAKTTPDRNDLVAITPATWAAMGKFVQNLDFSSLLQAQQHLRASEVQVKNTTQPRLWLEVTLLGLLPANQAVSSSVSNLAGKQVSARVSAEVKRETVERKPTSALPSTAPPVTASTQTAPIEVVLPPVATEQSDELSLEPDEENQADKTETVEASPTPTPINLEQMWQTVLEVLHPPGTQALFKQQGRLLDLGAERARIGITSQPLFKMAQMRIANLEAAFAQLVQHPVHVSLEVVPAQAGAANSASTSPLSTNSASASSAPISSAPASVANPSAVAASPPRPVVKESGQNGSAHRAESEVTYGAAKPAVPPEPHSVPDWQSEDEVSRAAKSLAQMFNGQIVSGSEEVPTPGAAALQASEPAIEPGDPDDDVPF
jgi:DNA polymerase-3 subunit gamma/tau